MKGFPNITNNLAELSDLFQGLRLVVEHNLTPMSINTNSMEVIKMLNTGHLPYNPIIFKCMSLMDRLGNPVIGHRFR